MSETVVWLLRHGETDANAQKIFQGQSEHPLNEVGLEQARLTAQRLKNEHFDAIFSSDLPRARMTAETALPGREIIYTPELREWDLGEWQGKTYASVKELFAEQLEEFKNGEGDFRPPGGESQLEFRTRAADFLQKAAGEYPGGKILFVTHGGILWNMLAHIMGVRAFKNRPQSSNCGLSIFSTPDSENWYLVRWNDIAHLPASGNTLIF